MSPTIIKPIVVRKWGNTELTILLRTESGVPVDYSFSTPTSLLLPWQDNKGSQQMSEAKIQPLRWQYQTKSLHFKPKCTVYERLPSRIYEYVISSSNTCAFTFLDIQNCKLGNVILNSITGLTAYKAYKA